MDKTKVQPNFFQKPSSNSTGSMDQTGIPYWHNLQWYQNTMGQTPCVPPPMGQPYGPNTNKHFKIPPKNYLGKIIRKPNLKSAVRISNMLNGTPKNEISKFAIKFLTNHKLKIYNSSDWKHKQIYVFIEDEQENFAQWILLSKKELDLLVADECYDYAVLQGNPNLIPKVTSLILQDPDTKIEYDFANEPRLVGLKDGFYDIFDNTFLCGNIGGANNPFTSVYLNLSIADIKNAQSAPNPLTTWENYLNTITGNDELLKRTIKQAVGYILTRLPMTAIILLQGVTKSGKSTLIKLINLFTPPNMRKTVPAHSYGSRFSTGNIEGKILLQDPDLSPKPISDTAMGNIKKIYSNGDTLQSESKGEDAFDITFNGRGLWSTNYYFDLANGLEPAFLERLRATIPFFYTIPEKDRDLLFLDNCKPIMGGIFLDCVTELLRYLKNNDINPLSEFRFEGNYEPNLVYEKKFCETKEFVSTIDEFFNACVKECPGKKMFLSDIMNIYNKYVKDNFPDRDTEIPTPNKLGNVLNEKLPNILKKRQFNSKTQKKERYITGYDFILPQENQENFRIGHVFKI